MTQIFTDLIKCLLFVICHTELVEVLYKLFANDIDNVVISNEERGEILKKEWNTDDTD
jgi:hypothetical protein